MYLSRIRATEGDIVAAGQEIGLSGGQNTPVGPHIEFQIRQQKGNQPLTLNPENWLIKRR